MARGVGQVLEKPKGATVSRPPKPGRPWRQRHGSGSVRNQDFRVPAVSHFQSLSGVSSISSEEVFKICFLGVIRRAGKSWLFGNCWFAGLGGVGCQGVTGRDGVGGGDTGCRED